MKITYYTLLSEGARIVIAFRGQAIGGGALKEHERNQERYAATPAEHAIDADQLGWVWGVNVGIYGSPMECLGLVRMECQASCCRFAVVEAMAWHFKIKGALTTDPSMPRGGWAGSSPFPPCFL